MASAKSIPRSHCRKRSHSDLPTEKLNFVAQGERRTERVHKHVVEPGRVRATNLKADSARLKMIVLCGHGVHAVNEHLRSRAEREMQHSNLQRTLICVSMTRTVTVYQVLSEYTIES